jgi:hypothetical protein
MRAASLGDHLGVGSASGAVAPRVEWSGLRPIGKAVPPGSPAGASRLVVGASSAKFDRSIGISPTRSPSWSPFCPSPSHSHQAIILSHCCQAIFESRHKDQQRASGVASFIAASLSDSDRSRGPLARSSPRRSLALVAIRDATIIESEQVLGTFKLELDAAAAPRWHRLSCVDVRIVCSFRLSCRSLVRRRPPLSFCQLKNDDATLVPGHNSPS